MTAILLTVSTIFLPAYASERVRLDEHSIVIDKKYLRPLVEKLESQKWLTRETTRLRLELKLTTRFADSLRAELELRKKLLTELKNSLSIAHKMLENAGNRVAALELNAKDYRDMRIESEKLDRSRTKKITSLRRRLAGQKIALWTVSAVGGALIFFILI
ncbi:MAG: hypothetical protein ACE5EN_10545 [Nitrospinota bacterium]